MSHSKRNTSLAFFTSHERNLLKTTWGSQKTRLSRDSFLPFASCRLCLQTARDPVGCATGGEVFCRECIVNNLLAQRKEIKRLEKETSRRRNEEKEEERERGQQEKERAITQFEQVMMGLEGGDKKVSPESLGGDVPGPRHKDPRGTKRKFELDEDEMLKNAKAERARAREALDEENTLKPTLPSFWVPSLTPSTSNQVTPEISKLSPVCPASSTESPHFLSLKSLVSIHFTTTESVAKSAESSTLICPACKKILTNTLKAMLAIPCGHVLCKPCVERLITSTKHSDSRSQDQEARIACYICETELVIQAHGKRVMGDTHRQAKEWLTPRLVEIKSEGTGFASGGTNLASKEGIVFQC